jgi:hypothetical protein
VVVAGTAIVWRRTVPSIVDDAVLQSPPMPRASAPAPSLAPALANGPKVQAPGKHREAATRTLADRVPTPAAPAPSKVTASQDSLAHREPMLSVTTMATGAVRADARGAAAIAHAACYRIIEPSGVGLAPLGSRVLALDDAKAARPKAMEMRATIPPEPATADARRPMPGEIRDGQGDTVVVAWREGGQSFRVRAVMRGDSLIEVRNAAPDSVPVTFRAVRIGCPGP